MLILLFDFFLSLLVLHPLDAVLYMTFVAGSSFTSYCCLFSKSSPCLCLWCSCRLCKECQVCQMSCVVFLSFLLSISMWYACNFAWPYVFICYLWFVFRYSAAFLVLYGIALATEGWGVVASLKIYPPFAGAAVSAITLVVAFGFAFSRPCLTLKVCAVSSRFFIWLFVPHGNFETILWYIISENDSRSLQ